MVGNAVCEKIAVAQLLTLDLATQKCKGAYRTHSPPQDLYHKILTDAEIHDSATKTWSHEWETQKQGKVLYIAQSGIRE